MRGKNGPFRYGSLCRHIGTLERERLRGARVAMTLGNKRFVFVVEEVDDTPDTTAFALGWGTAGEAPEQWIDGRSCASKWITEVSLDQVVHRLKWMCLGGRRLKGRVAECRIAGARPMRGYIWTPGPGPYPLMAGRGETG